jgi:membrane protease YdiL (CAAX protease family)
LKHKLLAYLILVAQVAVGLVLLVSMQQWKIPPGIRTGVIFAVFMLVNLVDARVFKVVNELNIYWSFKKIAHLPVGILSGLLLVFLPIIAALVFGKTSLNAITFTGISATGIFITFLTTGWEELWFRSILLNRCNRSLPAINIAVANGLLFMLVHLLNPQVNLAKDGLVLFLAGTLLTALYFYYQNIWLPAGIHFGNNFFGSAFHTGITANPVFGSDGYIYTAILFVAVLYFLLKLRTNRSPFILQAPDSPKSPKFNS